jgi:hypothetical protein
LKALDDGVLAHTAVHAVHDGLVNVDIPVPYLEVISAFGVGADPCLVLDGRTLAPEIGKRYEVPSVALETLGEIGLFHGSTSQPKLISSQYTLTNWQWQ